MILDAGVLVSVDRGERAAQAFMTAAHRRGTPLVTTEAVIAQVWRAGPRQARLAKFLSAIDVHPLDDGRAVGALLGRAGGSDVVDAHLVVVAVALQQPILTGDISDLETLAASVPAPRRPQVLRWP